MSEKGKQPLPPGPPQNLFVRKRSAFHDKSLPMLMENWQKYGDVVRVPYGGNSRVYLLAHPQHARHVLQEKVQIYQKQSWSLACWKELVGESLTTTDGNVWLQRRRLMQPSFHKKSLMALGETITHTTSEMLTVWEQATKQKTSIDVYEEMCRLTLTITVRALFGTHPSLDIDALYAKLNAGVTYIALRAEAPRPFPPNPFTGEYRRFLNIRKDIDTIIFHIIEQERRSSNSTPHLLSSLLAAQNEATGECLNTQQIRDEVLSTITAGYLTTAVTLTWIWNMLSIQPSLRSWLETELHTIPDKALLTIDDLAFLPRVEKLVKETMRLYPAVWMIPRTVVEDDCLPSLHGEREYRIPAGSTVLLSPYITHRHPEFWDNPEGFDPERFASQGVAARPRYAYFPFGGGGRQCIGNNLALIEIQLILATISRRYHLNLLSEPAMTLQTDDSIEFPHGAPMRIVSLKERFNAPHSDNSLTHIETGYRQE